MENLFAWLTSFISEGLYELITQAFASMIEWLTIQQFKFMIWSIGFAWDIGQKILADIGISQALQNAWGGLDSQTMSVLMFFRIPDAVNIILSSGVTRFVLRFIPGGV